MSAVISSLDTKQMPTRVGENLHPEFAWSNSTSSINDLREQFVQLFFQMVRVGHKGSGRITRLRELGIKYANMYKTAFEADTGTSTCADTASSSSSLEEMTHFREILLTLPNHTRDCVKGKGERDLAYALLLAKYDYESTIHSVGEARERLVNTVMYWCKGNDLTRKEGTPPPGSWKDILAICNFTREWCGETLTAEYNVIIRDLLRVMAIQVHKDTTSENPSLAAKWAPRESSKKQRCLFYRFVRAFTPSLGSPSQTPVTHPKFLSACKTLRKTLSSLNQTIKTLQVKQCAKKWSEIEPKTVPSIALQKQKQALLNLPRRGKVHGNSDEDKIRSSDPDRVKCATNFREYTQKAVNRENGAEIKASRTSLYDLVRDANVFNRSLTRDMDAMLLLEEQWKNNGKQVKAGLPPMIPMVDVSGSMTCDNNTPMYYAIGLGLRASEKTHPAFRNRVLTFSSDPAWVRLPEPPLKSDPEHEGSFINRVRTISNANWGMNTDFFKAMKMILDTLVKNQVPPVQAKGLVLAVFSDMQIDIAPTSSGTPQAMHDRIRKMYAEYDYDVPHVLYWNLRTTHGFPSVTTEKNVTMLSGFSPVLLNVLENKGIDALAYYTPFRMISEMLDSHRFFG